MVSVPLIPPLPFVQLKSCISAISDCRYATFIPLFRPQIQNLQHIACICCHFYNIFRWGSTDANAGIKQHGKHLHCPFYYKTIYLAMRLPYAISSTSGMHSSIQRYLSRSISSSNICPPSTSGMSVVISYCS